MTTNKLNYHLYKMDVLRGFAILMVFSLHSLQEYTNGVIEVTKGGPFIKDFSGEPWYLTLFTISPIGYGWSGVQLFFIISGFLIHQAYLRSKDQELNLKEFFIKRFFRIYPPYLVVLLVLVFLQNGFRFNNFENRWEFVSHLLMVYNFSIDTFFSYNGSFWSLALEVQLYFLYPVFLWIRNRFGIQNTLLFLLFLYIFFTGIRFFLQSQSLLFLVQTFVFKSWVIWGLGAWLGENYHFGKQTLETRFWVVVFLFFAFSTIKAFPFLSYFIDLIWALFYVVLVNYYLFTSRQIPVLWEKAFMKLGESSYSFYLIHQPILIALYGIISVFGLSEIYPAFHVLDALLILIIIQIASMICYYVLEKPSIDLGKKLLQKLRH